MDKELVIYGNGQMASMLYSYLIKDFNIVAFTTDSVAINSSNFLGLPVVPFDELRNKYDPKKFAIIIAVGFSDMNSLRVSRYEMVKAMGYSVMSYTHPTVELTNCQIGENVIILENTSIHPGSTIEDCTFISSNTNIGHDCIVRKGAWINGCVGVGGSTIIGKNCFIGIGAVIVNNIELSEMTYIGANSLVSKNTGPGDVLISKSADLIPMKSVNFLKLIS